MDDTIWLGLTVTLIGSTIVVRHAKKQTVKPNDIVSAIGSRRRVTFARYRNCVKVGLQFMA